MELFLRRNSSLVLTERGQKLYLDSSELAEFFKNKCSALTNEPKTFYQGAIFIATTHSFAACYLPDYIRKFHESNPMVNFIINSGSDSKNIINTVIRNDADFGLTSIDIVPGNITADLLHSAKLVLIAPKHWHFSTDESNSLINLEELAGVQFITSNNGIHTNKYIRTYLMEKGIQPRCYISTSNFADVRALVRAGLGCAIVENFELHNHDWYNVYKLPNVIWTSNYYIVRRKRKYISPQAEAFIKSILSADKMSEADS